MVEVNIKARLGSREEILEYMSTKINGTIDIGLTKSGIPNALYEDENNLIEEQIDLAIMSKNPFITITLLESQDLGDGTYKLMSVLYTEYFFITDIIGLNGYELMNMFVDTALIIKKCIDAKNAPKKNYTITRKSVDTTPIIKKYIKIKNRKEKKAYKNKKPIKGIDSIINEYKDMQARAR